VSGQTSGSISLDLSGVADAVVSGLGPVIAQINNNLERLAGLLASVALDESAAVDALRRHLPAGTASIQHADMTAVAEHLAEHLAAGGYALVAVAGPALEFEVRRNGFRGVVSDVAPVVDEATAQAIREDEWFADGRSD
jgi:hypothetical protein